MQVRIFYYTICKLFPKTQYWGRSILVLWQICFSRPVAFQDTLHHNTGYSEQNQFLTNFIKTKFQPGFKPKFKLEFKPKFKPETRAGASHDEPARSSFDSERRRGVCLIVSALFQPHHRCSSPYCLSVCLLSVVCRSVTPVFTIQYES